MGARDPRSEAEEFADRHWEAWKDDVLRTVRRKFKGAAADADLEAAYNEAWLELYRQLAQGQVLDNPRGFLVWVTRNRTIDELRRRRRSLPVEPERLRHVSDPAADVGRAVENREILDRWREATGGLSARQCLIARLAATGHTRPEIAELLGVRETSVHRAFERDRSKGHIGITARLQESMSDLADRGAPPPG